MKTLLQRIQNAKYYISSNDMADQADTLAAKQISEIFVD